MTNEYRQLKAIEALKAENAKKTAMIDYNIMMGILEDPEAEEDEEDE